MIGLRLSALFAFCLLLGQPALSQAAEPSEMFEVRLDPSVKEPVDGRLILVAADLTRQRLRMTQDQIRRQLPWYLSFMNTSGISADPAPASNALIAAVAQVRLIPGQTFTFDAAKLAFPTFSELKPGLFGFQVILDVNGDFAYDEKAHAPDLKSDLAAADLPGPHPLLVLKPVRKLPVGYDLQPPRERTFAGPPPNEEWFEQQGKDYAAHLAAKAHTEQVFFNSKRLSAFKGEPTDIRAYVLAPPGYEAGTDRYPTVFAMDGFGSSLDALFGYFVRKTYEDMASGLMPPMIWVFLDHSGPTGTTEFADSASNGPWGAALTEEFIPWLDAKYRTDGKASGRFTTGHSSGGWASLWLQVTYPKLFGGAWPTSPDPVDFHDYTNTDLYRPGANVYRQPDGSATPLVRGSASFEAFARHERVAGPVGGQMSSFDWVFSPRGADGKPVPLFDPTTGVVDPAVAAYWTDHYDITALIKRNWQTLKPDLDGKIHLWVGTRDTYYLDGPAHLLKAELDRLGANSEFHFVEGADHGTVMMVGRDIRGLERQIAWRIYATARPGAKLPAAVQP